MFLLKSKKSEKKRSFWLELKDLIKPYHSEIRKIFALIILLDLSLFLSPYIFKLIIDRLTHFNKGEIGQIIFLVILMFLADQLVNILNFWRNKKSFNVLNKIEYYLATKVYKKLLELSLVYHEKENTGNKIAKVKGGLFKIVNFLEILFWETIPVVFKLIVTLIILFFVDWRFGMAFLFFSSLSIYLTYRANKIVRPLRKQKYKKYEEASGVLGQTILNINTVKSFNQEEKELNKLSSIYKSILEKAKKEWNFVYDSFLKQSFVDDFGRAFILLLGVYFAWQRQITLGSLVFVIMLSERAYDSMWRLEHFYDRIEEGSEAVNRFVQIFQEPVDIESPPNGLKPSKVEGLIEFKDVDFSYAKGEPVLKKVSFKIEPNKITALVGPSGAGKTTISRLIFRHYDPQKGHIYLDGKDLKEYDLKILRSFLSFVPQEVEVFNGTVRENIAYANENASFQEIKEAARIANAEEFIEKLPQKYDTEIGERGIKLSGGQRQRLGIARAILAKAQILIFDEATSNLDSESENLIREAINKISQGKTIIIIAHRLSTIKRADKIIVLDEGKVIEEGTHQKLAQKKGLYARLLKWQKLGNIG